MVEKTKDPAPAPTPPPRDLREFLDELVRAELEPRPRPDFSREHPAIGLAHRHAFEKGHRFRRLLLVTGMAERLALSPWGAAQVMFTDHTARARWCFDYAEALIAEAERRVRDEPEAPHG